MDATNEFTLELTNGSTGIGSSPQGETISIYEDSKNRLDIRSVLDQVNKDLSGTRKLNQLEFDRYLQSRLETLGRNNCWALSLAFFNAMNSPHHEFWTGGKKHVASSFPRICLNILNGGQHAYTNPVLSDFPEFLIVPLHDDIGALVRDHKDIQQKVREGFRQCELIEINQNRVHRFATTDNRECLDFLAGVLESLGLGSKYRIMIDASAGDLWDGRQYVFNVTSAASKKPDEFVKYWTKIATDYGLGFLEDPFHERDFESWAGLVSELKGCLVIGDNFYSSNSERIREGASKKYTHGAIIKPNQAGTVSAVLEAVNVCQQNRLVAIASHRSISTESIFESVFTARSHVGYIKIGPLYTDYSSVLRFNELMRLTGADFE